MKIAEIYESVQGEGFLTGTDSIFVRTSGCNMRCWFCDTRYTSWEPEGTERPVDEIVDDVCGYQSRLVVVTVGVPLIQSDIAEFSTANKQQERYVTFETAGTVKLPVQAD